MYKEVQEFFIINNNYTLSIMYFSIFDISCTFLNLKCPRKKAGCLFVLHNMWDIKVKRSLICKSCSFPCKNTKLQLCVNRFCPPVYVKCPALTNTLEDSLFLDGLAKVLMRPKLRLINGSCTQNSHEDVKYSIGNVVNNIVRTVYGTRWVPEISGGTLCKVYDCLTTTLSTWN